MFKKREQCIFIFALVACALFFVSGYYFGKHAIAQEYQSLLHQSTVDERIQGAMYSFAHKGVKLEDTRQHAEVDASEEVESDDSSSDARSGDARSNDASSGGVSSGGTRSGGAGPRGAGSSSAGSKSAGFAPAETVDSTKTVSKNQLSSSGKAEVICRGYAQLAGFGSRSKAETYRDKLAQAGYAVRVVDHESRSRRSRRGRGTGKVQHWYQVVTDVLPLKILQKMVDDIAARDKLVGCKIINI